MTFPLLAARAVIAAATLALLALGSLHILKPEIHPSRNMISQYALGRHGWVMALFSGKMHGVLFLIGVPCQLLATLLLSLAADSESSNASIPLLLTGLIWLSFVTMMAIMLMVGPGKPSNPNGPERFLGLPNRLFMITYGVWLMAAAWPMAH